MSSDDPTPAEAAAGTSGAPSEGQEADAGEGGRASGRPRRTVGPRGGHRAVYQSDTGGDPACRVYVGNLSWDVTWSDLKDHMKSTGCEVTRANVLASPDGRSKGCGIVEFTSAEDAQKAILTLNDTELMGRQIFVREDREGSSGGGYYTQQVGGAAGGAAGGSRFASGGEAQSRRVYVGNLSWDVAWQDLKDHMREAGEVVYCDVMKEHDGRSKGCGIVEYASSDEAQEAIKTLTDTELKGRMIFVREDREVSSGGGAFGGRGGCNVYVGNLSYETSWQDLKDHMRQAGNVDKADILEGPDGRSKGCAIVQYQKPQDAARAMRELQNSELNGRPIFVREDREAGGFRGRGGGGGFRGGHRGGGGGGGGAAAEGCQLFVGNLSYDTTWRDLKDHFRQCGEVERADVKRGFGTVRFSNAEEAKSAIEQLNGVELQGRELEVRIDEKP